MRTTIPSVVRSANQWAQRDLDSPVEVFAALREWKNSFR
jgi:hydroxyacylglutathione hydrolase